MILMETLSLDDKIRLFSGDVVGIFPTMILSNDKYYNMLYDICFGYYNARSGNKTISATYKRIKEIVEQNNSINENAEELIGKLIRGKFIDKWNRVYDVLLFEQYNALDNYTLNEHKVGNNKDTDTYNNSKAKIGNNTDVTEYDTNITDDGKTGTYETTTRNVDTDDNVYGFNSASPVGDSTSNENATETLIADANKNTTHNTQIKTGTDSKTFGINETETKTGTDTTDRSINETVTKSGRDGSGAKLVMEELDLRNQKLFFDIIYADIDSIATLQIYI